MSRDELTNAVLLTLREASGLGALHSQAMAERLGVSSTDLECLDIIAMRGPITAGELARASGLTSGAITGLVDRLERAGLAKREPDAADRRKVMLRVTPAVEKRGAGLAKPMQDAMTALLSDYDDKTLALLLDILTRANAAALGAIQTLRGRPAPRHARDRIGQAGPSPRLAERGR
jgi:DNA-binding MarR family transcriptional regulator